MSDTLDELASTTPLERVIFIRVENMSTTNIEYMGPFYARLYADDFARHLTTHTDGAAYKIDYYTLSKLA
jgi:hypothetical protein